MDFWSRFPLRRETEVPEDRATRESMAARRKEFCTLRMHGDLRLRWDATWSSNSSTPCSWI